MLVLRKEVNGVLHVQKYDIVSPECTTMPTFSQLLVSEFLKFAYSIAVSGLSLPFYEMCFSNIDWRT